MLFMPPVMAAKVPSRVCLAGQCFEVENAVTPEERSRGLMFRKKLEPGQGMFFIFGEAGRYPFWMKNTRIPLDMIWIDARKNVVHVERQVPPCETDPCMVYDPGVDASYVLEVAGGVLSPSVVPGTRVKF